jgi:hypothetical protein
VSKKEALSRGLFKLLHGENLVGENNPYKEDVHYNVIDFLVIRVIK